MPLILEIECKRIKRFMRKLPVKSPRKSNVLNINAGKKKKGNMRQLPDERNFFPELH